MNLKTDLYNESKVTHPRCNLFLLLYNLNTNAIVLILIVNDLISFVINQAEQMCIADRMYKNITFCAMVCTAVDYITHRALLEEENHYHCPANKLVTMFRSALHLSRDLQQALN